MVMSAARSLRVRTIGLEQAQKQPLAWKCRQERRGKWTPADRLNEHLFQHARQYTDMSASWQCQWLPGSRLSSYIGTYVLLHMLMRFDLAKENQHSAGSALVYSYIFLFDCNSCVAFRQTSFVPAPWFRLKIGRSPVLLILQFQIWIRCLLDVNRRTFQRFREQTGGVSWDKKKRYWDLITHEG